MAMSIIRIQVLLATAIATSVAAQATHQVGAGGFAQIGHALAIAAPGDLIVVQPGTYLPFDLYIGVRIVAPAGATVTPTIGASFSSDLHVPAGQKAALVGLEFRTVSSYPPAIAPVQLSVAGHAVFADCQFQSVNADNEGSAVTCNGDVQFDRCLWRGLDDCLTVEGGFVELNDCDLRGLWQVYNQGPAHAIVALGGVVRVFSSTLRGSDGDQSISCPGNAAIVLAPSARLLIADSTVTGGDGFYPSCTPPPGIINQSTAAVLHARSNITGGMGGVGWPPVITQGPPFQGPALAAALAGGLGPVAGPEVGSSYDVTVFGPIGCCAAIGMTFERELATPVSFATPIVHFSPGQVFAYQWGAIGTPLPNWPAFGAMTVNVPLPGSAFGLEFWLHPLVWDGATFQVGPTLGGVVR